MKRNLEFFTESPLVWFTGWSMILGIIASFVIILVSIVHGPDDMQSCIDKGGSWSHTLTQPEKYDGTNRNGNVENDAHYDDACTMPGRSK